MSVEKTGVVKCERGDKYRHIHAATQGLNRRPELSAQTDSNRVHFVISESYKVIYGSIWTQQQASLIKEN